MPPKRVCFRQRLFGMIVGDQFWPLLGETKQPQIEAVMKYSCYQYKKGAFKACNIFGNIAQCWDE